MILTALSLPLGVASRPPTGCVDGVWTKAGVKPDKVKPYRGRNPHLP
ncbi:hypothetical protein [Streptomyces sp. KN37]|nr:hypothetical protein [Streptomyces sp. KN37]WPO76186.1 hypothetical protein R9806_36485 [Streptomyces sp. KN37]